MWLCNWIRWKQVKGSVVGWWGAVAWWLTELHLWPWRHVTNQAVMQRSVWRWTAGLEGRRGSTAPLSQCINPLCSLCSFVLSPLIYVRWPPPFLSSVSPLSEHSLAFYSAASSDNHAPNLFGHSLPPSVPTPLSRPSPLPPLLQEAWCWSWWLCPYDQINLHFHLTGCQTTFAHSPIITFVAFDKPTPSPSSSWAETDWNVMLIWTQEQMLIITHFPR